LGETGEKHTSGPKGRVDSVAFTPGMSPRPTLKQGFSAACEAESFLGFVGTTKVVPYHKG
jgi:hypothetical protein